MTAKSPDVLSATMVGSGLKVASGSTSAFIPQAPLATPVLFPVAGAPAGLFDRPIGVGHMYNAVQQVVLDGQVDAIVYLPRVTPMRL